MAYLMQRQRDGTKVREWDLAGKTLSFGRGDTVGVQIDDQGMSREHFRITASGQGYLLEDLASKNGTFVNGARVTSQTLKQNDRIQAGDTLFVFVDGLQTVVRQLEREDRHLSTFIREIDKKP